MNIFLREMERFFDKYSAQPDPVDEQATIKYWEETDSAMLTWYKKYEGREGYQKLIIACFEFLEILFKEKMK